MFISLYIVSLVSLWIFVSVIDCNDKSETRDNCSRDKKCEKYGKSGSSARSSANRMTEYVEMEEVIKNKVMKPFVSLSDKDRSIRNGHLEAVIKALVSQLRETDPMFAAMYGDIFYGGSYYDGLNVGVPKDYDLDLLMRLPKYAEPDLNTSERPGFVRVKVTQADKWLKQPEAQTNYRKFDSLYDSDKYLNVDKVLTWFHSTLQKALNTFPKEGKGHKIVAGAKTYNVVYKKSGPAYTLVIKCPDLDKELEVDLVPCFVFTGDKWPQNGFKSKMGVSNDFFIVPKKPKEQNLPNLDRCWRLSFQKQERELLKARGGRIKDTIKLLKKLRDTLGHKAIASYYLKTVVLHIADKKDKEVDKSFWSKPLSHTFMTVLKMYKTDFIDKGAIQYYWSKNKNNNLIGFIADITLFNYKQRLAVVIDKVDKNYKTKPSIILEFLLTPQETKIEDKMHVLSLN